MSKEKVRVQRHALYSNSTYLQVPAFINCFDATASMRSKAQLARLNPQSLKPNDLVLVESHIHRWPLEKGEERAAFWKARNWKTWKAEYKLDSIYLLYAAYEVMNDETPGEDIEI